LEDLMAKEKDIMKLIAQKFRPKDISRMVEQATSPDVPPAVQGLIDMAKDTIRLAPAYMPDPAERERDIAEVLRTIEGLSSKRP
jgi:hypothetical protein